MSEPGAVELIDTILPALALADVREALDKESANRAYLLLLSPASKLAWDSLPRRVAAPQKAYNACVVAAHCLDLQSDSFWVMPLAGLAAAARAASSVGAATPSVAALRAAADALDAKGAHAQGARAAAEDRAAATAAAEAPRPRALRCDEVSSDAQLEAFARDFRTSSVPPTREDIMIPGGGPRDTAAAAGGDNAGGDDGIDGVPGAARFLRVPALPYNRTRGAFPSLNAYIATHFRLLREDAIAALRKGLLAVRDGAPLREVHSSCRTYAHVRSVGTYWGKRRVGWRLRFARPGGRKISAQVLLTGSLLCLVPRGDTDLERIVFATVASRDNKLLDDRKGPFIDIEEVIHDSEVDFDNDFASEDSDEEGGGAMAARHAALRRSVFDETAEYTMYESSTYFESYRHVLAALQTIPDNPTRLPFCEELLGGAATRAPAYLDAPRAAPLRLADAFPRFLASAGSETISDVRAPWPTFDSGLNQSQLDAVKLALRNRVALIQGPPGCGKTHVGVLLTRLLLASSPDRPLLFVCYTNHALDQLLEHVHEFEKSIVRGGFRSQNELMQSLTLTSWRDRDRNAGKTPEQSKISKGLYSAKEEQKAAKKRIELAFEAATADGMTEQDLPTLSSFVPWARRAVECLLARRDLLTRSTEARAESAGEPDFEAWQLTPAERKRRKREVRANSYLDLVARFLHARGDNIVDDDDDDGEGDAPVGAADTDTRAVVENEELALDEAARRVDTETDEGIHDAAFVNLRAVAAARTAERVAARGGGAGGRGTTPAPGGGGLADEEAGVSDEDVEGGGPARAVARRGQQVLSLEQLRVWCERRDPWELSLRNRRQLIDLWCDERAVAARSALASARAAYGAAGDTILALESRSDGLILRKARVIGFTTTGAAKARRLLESVAPKVLIVEEAAEVLESHILAALVPSVQHAVLIGDHQQLRPKVETIDLARRHALSVSMFERLINNNVPHITLDTQHRMRPEFAALLTPSIYPRLLNAPTTHGRPHVRGVAHDSFFVSHEQPETSAADRGGVGGYANAHEAGLIVAFTEYLLRNGARGADIVVLVAYQSQATLIRTMVLERISALQAAFARGGAGATVLGLHEPAPFAAPPADGRPAPPPPKYGLSAVRVSTIDNYQGEEARLVLLSLVRSSPTKPQSFRGFMRESNRVCVALSRAREGLFIFGNGKLHRAVSPLWTRVIETLEAAGTFGAALPLACAKHPDRVTRVSTVAEFAACGSGGCALPCEERLSCGHTCPQVCHPDGHELFRCSKKCTRERECGHGCTKLCWLDCGVCDKRVERDLACGHSAKMLCAAAAASHACTDMCGRAPFAATCGHPCSGKCSEPCPSACLAEVERAVPSCAAGHVAAWPCSAPPPASCPAPCGAQLQCGHACNAACGECSSAAAAGSTAAASADDAPAIHAPCQQRCTRIGLCGHKCIATHPCHTRCPPCPAPCNTRCEHSKCSAKCAAPCPPCVEQCRVRCPHTACTLLCRDPCNRPRCDVPCPKVLRSCGHPCIGLCGEPCPTRCRVCDAGVIDVLTRETLGEADADARFVQLECGHVAGTELLDGWMDSQDVAAPPDEGDGEDGSPIAPRAIKLPACPECRTFVRRSFRYGAIVRRAIIEIEGIKARAWVGPEFRQSAFAGVDMSRSRDIKAAITATDARAKDAPRAVTVRAVLGELNSALAAMAPERCVPLRSAARGAFEEALRLIGCDDRGQRVAAPTADPPLSARATAYEAYVALRGLGLLLLRSKDAGMHEAARVRLVAASSAAQAAGVTEALDIDAALADVASAERLAVAAAIAGTNGGAGTWYTCPNGHRYVVGECGAGMETSRCPDCHALIGGQSHTMVAGNLPVGARSPYEAAMNTLPLELIRRIQLGEA